MEICVPYSTEMTLNINVLKSKWKYALYKMVTSLRKRSKLSLYSVL